MLIRNDIDKLNNLFTTWIGESIIDFKIVLLLNSRIEIHFLVNEKIDIEKLFLDFEDLKGLEKIITFYQIEFEDDEDKEWFEGEKIDLGLRRRLTNFIKPNVKEIKKPCPILTFYSYKGGTGRTTALAFFASWLATNYSKKVVIIDCDFEAPGLTNYFDISEERKGIAEYLLDADYAKFKGQILDIKKDYAHKVRYEYVGKGDIFIIPAGNLSNEKVNENNDRTHLSDYLEALARLDLTSVNHIIEQFESFFADLQTQLELDFENSIILIDSRTGFNDTFAVLSTLSDIIVGFFGINKQSQVGITQFLDNFGTIENSNNKQIILVNSISENRGYETVFKDIINTYISENEQKFVDAELGKKDFINNIYRIPRIDFLSRIGTKLENVDRISVNSNTETINGEFYDYIRQPDVNFKPFLNGIYEKIDYLIEIRTQLNVEHEEYKQTETLSDLINTNIIINDVFFDKIKNKVDRIVRRERVLRTLIDDNNFPKSHSESFKEKPQLSDFYFRDCMKDIFNIDKFVIIGYKGTGKTHIYRSFENTEITKILCKREKQNHDKYIFVNVIPISDNLKFFSTEDNFMENEKKINQEIGKDYFFKNFWLIYTWSSLFKNIEIKKLLKPSIEIFEIVDANTKQILNIIEDREKISLIQKDFENIDKILQTIQKTVILSYDQLDFVVKPNKWNEGVAPLINFWRNKPFSKIYPKIFVRADIYENKFGNITNFSEIQSENSISLQWSKHELFAYFFKYIFKVSKEDFFALAYCYKNYFESTKKMLIKIETDLDEIGQISILKEEHLKFLVEIFFGKSANRSFDTANNFGDTYDWFYNNLTDAKNAISIRPFLDLMKSAINFALLEKSLESEKIHSYNSKQILSAFYYTSNQATYSAAESYYENLQKDPGNEAISLFADFLKYRTNKAEYKKYEFNQFGFNHLLGAMMDKYKNDDKLKNINRIDDFIHILRNNGIIKVEGQGTKIKYIIPFLYRRYLDVGNPIKKTNSIELIKKNQQLKL